MCATIPRRAIDAVLMRGGTSRGAVLRADCLPKDALLRDAAIVRLVGGDTVQTDAVGGGTPTTSKLVLVMPVLDDPSGIVLEYAVGNIVFGQNAVDWSGTCGNMTAAVPLYALEEEIIPASWEAPIRLRNISTGGLIETSIQGMKEHERGQQAVVHTRFLNPAGAVTGRLLPTKSGLERITVGAHTYQASVVDVTHPYLFLLYDEVVGQNDLRDPVILERIERLRGEISAELGLGTSHASAAVDSPAVPRVVLIHRGESEKDALRISAISMGQAIASIPVTAAMCLAAASRIPTTLVAQNSKGATNGDQLTVVSSGSRMTASAQVAANGDIASVAVDRTVRTIMRGTAWI